MIKYSLFREQLDQIGMQNNRPELAFLNLFIDDTVFFSTSVELARYVSFICENQDNYKLYNNIVVGDEKKNDKDIDMSGRSLDNLHELYSIYNQYVLQF